MKSFLESRLKDFGLMDSWVGIGTNLTHFYGRDRTQTQGNQCNDLARKHGMMLRTSSSREKMSVEEYKWRLALSFQSSKTIDDSQL